MDHFKHMCATMYELHVDHEMPELERWIWFDTRDGMIEVEDKLADLATAIYLNKVEAMELATLLVSYATSGDVE